MEVNLTWKMKKNQLLGTEEKTEGTVTETVKKTEKEDIKTFTQEEVNAMLTKERKKMPSKEELEAFKEWQETQKTVEQKQAEKEAEHQKTLLRNTELENENKVFKAGVEKDNVDYVAYKVSKMDGDFEENLTKYLKDNYGEDYKEYVGIAYDEPKRIKDDEHKITINKYHNISSAFESWFDINFPKFKSDTNENYKILKDKVIKFIDDCINEEDESDNKEILHWFKSDIEKMEGSLKEQIKYSLEMFKECIVNVKKNLIDNYDIEYDSEDELNENISNTFKNTRNRIAHGNMKNEILFSDMDVVAYVIVERLVQCLVFYKANVDMNKIKEIVDDRF